MNYSACWTCEQMLILGNVLLWCKRKCNFYSSEIKVLSVVMHLTWNICYNYLATNSSVIYLHKNKQPTFHILSLYWGKQKIVDSDNRYLNSGCKFAFNRTIKYQFVVYFFQPYNTLNMTNLFIMIVLLKLSVYEKVTHFKPTFFYWIRNMRNVVMDEYFNPNLMYMVEKYYILESLMQITLKKYIPYP